MGNSSTTNLTKTNKALNDKNNENAIILIIMISNQSKQ